MNKEYIIKIISPVHIGSGEKYSNNIDYYSDATGTYLIDTEKFFQSLTNEQINELTNELSIVDFMDRYKINKANFRKQKLSSQQLKTQEIKQFTRDGLALPYIPGSSIKGALRTVIGHYLFKEEKPKFEFNSTNRERAYSKMNNVLFGEDPKVDFLKGFMVVDSFFKPQDVMFMQAKVFTMNKEKQLSVKLRDVSNRNSEMQIYCEYLQEDVISRVKIRVDDFFFSDVVRGKLGISVRQKESLINLKEIANEYAKDKIRKEFELFRDQALLPEVGHFYKRLWKLQKAHMDHSFILNVGWGTGWHFKTGDYINEGDLEGVRQKYKLGKMINNECIKPFPKSRKVLIDESNKPYVVPGWVMLTEV